MSKLLLIDGPNMAHRCFWVNRELKWKARSVNVIYGFLRQLISLEKHFPDCFRIISWEGGSKRRNDESEKGVEKGIIASSYKANRDREITPELEDLHGQISELKNCLELVRCLQVMVCGFEGDDVINSYVHKNLSWGGESIIVSSDNDFYPLLVDNKVSVYDAMKHELWTAHRFRTEFGFEPELWRDVCALKGEKGDNIHGVDGWGPVTAVKYVREYGTLDNIIEAVKAKKKRNKKEDVLLASIDRVRLAYSLKSMDVLDVPMPRILKSLSADALRDYFLEYGFISLLKDIKFLI